ncbi:hypothetical protein [Myroides marinus]|uniref:hypothetical protein n=1 Tax=Myroides marinus TaxID=703342 RepID=UPI0025784BFE|nr:hypothetical protein [Myroides marinus]MDM1346492.1 hypothetical protein [Myroides marinus]MDM1349911.1 hypothetical protein [Myroides marinus]MDM1357119.1 hypothetical protein [Myroides marinus]
MNNNNKLDLTKYILQSFLSWYKEVGENVENNDLSILKSLKLFFLLSTIDSNEENNLASLGFTNYSALPLGPVEMDVYGYFKNELTEVISRTCLNKNKMSPVDIEAKEKEIIDSLVSKLKTKNKELIQQSASYLVDLTHKYASWIKSYNQAVSSGRSAQAMDMEFFRTEDKFYYL